MLTFVYLHSGAIEEFHHLRHHCGIGTGYELGGHSEHGIARKDGCVVVPLYVHGGLAATNVGFIHHIVVQKGEIVIHLKTHCRHNGFLDVATHCLACHKHKHRAYALAAKRHCVGYRFVEVRRLCRIRQILDGCVHALKILVECKHIVMIFIVGYFLIYFDWL